MHYLATSHNGQVAMAKSQQMVEMNKFSSNERRELIISHENVMIPIESIYTHVHVTLLQMSSNDLTRAF